MMPTENKMEWIKIERDKDGFATEECINKMTDNLPIVIVEQFNEHGIEQFYDIVTSYNIADYMGDMTIETKITHYLPILQAPVI